MTVVCACASSPPTPVAPAAPVASAWQESAIDCHVHYDLASAPVAGATAVNAALEPIANACVLSPGYRSAPGCEGPPCESQREWTRNANDWTVGQAVSSQGQLPFCGVPIGYPWGPAEVLRCGEAGGRGLKLHTDRAWVDLQEPATASNLQTLIAMAAEAGIPVLVHVTFDQAQIGRLFDIANAVPDAQIVVAHQLGPMLPMLLEAPANVWTEVSGLVLIDRAQRESLLPLWRAFGTDRILLGSDWPLIAPAEYLEALQNLPLSDAERAAIASGNAVRLFETAATSRRPLCESRRVYTEVRRKQVATIQCFESAMKRGIDRGGSLWLRWSVGADGSVSSVRTLGTDFDDDELRQCMEDTIATFAFAKTDAGACSAMQRFQFRTPTEMGH